MTSSSDRPRLALAGRGPAVRAVPEDATAGDITALWAEQQFTALGVDETPEYGSAAWVQLRADDPRRAAAIIEAAELWRRHRAREAWLEQLLDDDPERWYRIVTEDAHTEARRIAGAIAQQPTHAELAERRARYGPVREVTATEGWPPVAIPGRPGWHRHLIDGRQVDLPHNNPPGQETSA